MICPAVSPRSWRVQKWSQNTANTWKLLHLLLPSGVYVGTNIENFHCVSFQMFGQTILAHVFLNHLVSHLNSQAHNGMINLDLHPLSTKLLHLPSYWPRKTPMCLSRISPWPWLSIIHLILKARSGSFQVSRRLGQTLNKAGSGSIRVSRRLGQTLKFASRSFSLCLPTRHTSRQTNSALVCLPCGNLGGDGSFVNRFQ